MCSCHSILECCVTFSGVKLSIRSFVLFLRLLHRHVILMNDLAKLHVVCFSKSFSRTSLAHPDLKSLT